MDKFTLIGWQTAFIQSHFAVRWRETTTEPCIWRKRNWHYWHYWCC